MAVVIRFPFFYTILKYEAWRWLFYTTETCSFLDHVVYRLFYLLLHMKLQLKRLHWQLCGLFTESCLWCWKTSQWKRVHIKMTKLTISMLEVSYQLKNYMLLSAP